MHPSRFRSAFLAIVLLLALAATANGMTPCLDLCWEGYHACTSGDPDLVDWERCDGVLEACKERCHARGEGDPKGDEGPADRATATSEGPPCFVPVPTRQGGDTLLNPGMVSEYRADGPGATRVWIAGARGRKLPISADRFEEILGEACPAGTEETESALVLDAVTRLGPESSFGFDWLTSYIWDVALSTALDEGRMAGWTHGLLNRANAAEELGLTPREIDELAVWLAEGIHFLAAQYAESGGVSAAMKPERVQ